MSGRSKCRRIGAAIAVSALGAVAVPVVAGPAAAQTPSVLNCNVTTYRVLFWPEGHKAIKSQDFPAYPVPHVELFTGTGKNYPGTDSLGYVDSAGQTSHPPSCVAASLTGQLGGPIPTDKMKTITKAASLACTAAAATVIVVPTPAKAQLSVALPGQTVANAVMSGTGSELSYDSSMCKPGKVPKK